MKLPVAPALAALLYASSALLCAQDPAPPTEKPAEKAPMPPAEPPPKPAPKPLKPTKPTKPGEPLTTRSAVDSLTEAELDQVISLLKENYIDPEALAEDDLKRATVQGIIDRIAPGARIVEAPVPGSSQASLFRAEILDARIGYARLGATVPGNVAELDAALANFTEKNSARSCSTCAPRRRARSLCRQRRFAGASARKAKCFFPSRNRTSSRSKSSLPKTTRNTAA